MTTKSPEPPNDGGPSTSSVPAQGTSSADKAATPPTKAAAPPANTVTPPTKAAAPPAKAAGPSGKSAPPAKATAGSPRPPRGGGGAFTLAVLALLVAVGATGIALYSLDVAREAKSHAAPMATGQAAAPTANASAPPAGTAIPSPRGPLFVPELVRTELQLPSPDNCNSIYVDVDTTQVGVYTGHEFYLSSCLGPSAMRIDRTSGAAPTSENPTPEGCAAQLAGAATTTELVLPVRADLTFCLLTNKADATQQGIPQRMGIVAIKDVRADRSVIIVLSTYRMPTPSER
jgi:hypothetical protein